MQEPASFWSRLRDALVVAMVAWIMIVAWQVGRLKSKESADVRALRSEVDALAVSVGALRVERPRPDEDIAEATRLLNECDGRTDDARTRGNIIAAMQHLSRALGTEVTFTDPVTIQFDQPGPKK